MAQTTKCLQQSKLFSSKNEKNDENENRPPEDVKVEAVSPVHNKGNNEAKNLQKTDPEKDAVESIGLTRTLLLAVPLFCKLIIVLMIKFLTDLVVFPLLYLYRFARLTKRKIKSLFTASSSSKSNSDLSKIQPNGTATTTTTNGLEKLQP